MAGILDVRVGVVVFVECVGRARKAFVLIRTCEQEYLDLCLIHNMFVTVFINNCITLRVGQGQLVTKAFPGLMVCIRQPGKPAVSCHQPARWLPGRRKQCLLEPDPWPNGNQLSRWLP